MGTGERERRLRGCTESEARKPAGELLSRLPWERQRPDPQRMSAEQFLGVLPG